VELDPADPVSWLAKGRVSRLVDPTDNGPAMFALQKSLALDSMNADAWFEFGTVRQELLDDDATEKAWLRAAALNPTDAQTLSFLGFHYMWRGEYARGVPWTDSAIKLDPTTVVARESAAELALELGRPVIAQRHWDVQIRVLTGRQQGAPLAMIARAYLAQGDTATARSYVRRAEGVADIKNPNRHEAVWIGSAYAAIGDTAAAIRILKAYQPRGDLHFQLHMKRDPGLRWLRGKLGEGLLFPDPRK
jgi:tetratricopeptide (TPR) repeat protein